MKKKIALVTGASGGIGGACAELLAQEGYTVLVHGCHGIENAKTLADRLCAQGYDAHAVCCDLADSESARRMCREILALYHHVDALALCAGVSHTGLFCDMTDAEWHTVMDVNVSGAFYLIHLFTLFRAPHSNTRRIDRCKGRAGLTACSFLLQNKEPSLFYYSTPSIFFQYNSKNRSEFLVPNYVLPYESTFLPSGCTSMAHNTAYWYGKQCKELRQLLFP